MPFTKPQTFEPDGRAIRLVDEGEGPVIVLIPGRGLNISSLGTLAHVLVEEGFRIVRVDARRPGGVDQPVTMHDLAEDVVDVMDHLDIGSAWIAGHAFGGAVARTVALDHRDRAEGVLLLGVQGSQAPADDAAAALRTAFSDAAEEEALAAMRVVAGGSVDPEFAWSVFSGARDPEVEPMQSAALAVTPTREWTAVAESLPMLIIQGTDDRITVPANGESLQASAADRASLARIEGGGHLFVMTHPGEIGAEVEDYLAWD